MAQVINTNVSSLLAQRNLAKSTDAMSTAIQRLSSGLKINSAKDDAAGLAISTLMTAQINGVNKAAQNSNDAISLSQIAEGGMGTATDILQDMRMLAVQAANGTNSSADRLALQDEVTQLIGELNDIANFTQFNGQSILNGAFSSATFQIGANANQTTSFGIESISASAVGFLATATGTNVAAATATDITIAMAGTPGSKTIASSALYATSITGQGAGSAFAKAAAINAANVNGLSVTAKTQGTTGALTFAGGAYDLDINGITIFNGDDTGLTATTLNDLINSQSSQTGVVSSLDATGTIITLTAADGRDITVTETGDTPLTASGSFTSGTALTGQLTMTGNNVIYLGGTIANLGFSSGTIMTDTSGIDTLDISTQSGAQTAIQRIDSALASISSNRAAMGAMENRFEATIANLENISDNTQAARSRIQDTDYAAEMATLTKNQILQQAGTAMLAQANSMPQSVLSLLS
ncbi:flagellin N-terminal helical domain-containing protein [Legionella saoudiensis]|uniref:flagellin N-terminal helical domain-containing protein n=1 Tax=Legionella saoudiensis TaxID=1750561 RepID=UPI00073098F2|nr:flagellin [Legionella saoudiensis]